MRGFQKAYNAKHTLCKLLALWQKSLDKMGFLGSIPIDLSKTFCLLHNLLLAKLQAYSFSKGNIKFLLSHIKIGMYRFKFKF